MNYEQEEEFLTNDLSRKLLQVSLSLKREKKMLSKYTVHQDRLLCEERKSSIEYSCRPL